MKLDYIDRAAIRDRLYEEDEITMKGVAIINTFPAADVVERKKGKWRERYTNTTDNEAIGFYSCSECGFRDGWNTNFCPNCGADMRNTP